MYTIDGSMPVLTECVEIVWEDIHPPFMGQFSFLYILICWFTYSYKFTWYVYVRYSNFKILQRIEHVK
jgi:hypothetical protein